MLLFPSDLPLVLIVFRSALFWLRLSTDAVANGKCRDCASLKCEVKSTVCFDFCVVLWWAGKAPRQGLPGRTCRLSRCRCEVRQMDGVFCARHIGFAREFGISEI